jgi:polyhydroxyalkanoate synthase subunit PhaC
LINKPTLLDLAPGLSMIEGFVNSGFEVYLLDFGIPGHEDGDISIENYIMDYIQKGVQKSLRHSGAEEISIMGFCLGGTLAIMYAAVADEPIRNLILSTTPIDFNEFFPGFDQWSLAARDGSANFDGFLDAVQTVPPKFIKEGLRLLSSPLYYSKYLTLLSIADKPQSVDRWRHFNEWTIGHIPFTGPALKQMMNDLGKHNKLIKGNLYIKNKAASLKNIKSNLLVVSAENDKLFPLEMATPIMDMYPARIKHC